MTKTEKIKRCQDILKKYPIGATIDSNDFDYMISIFEGHTEWQKKKGNGIKYIIIEYIYGNKYFKIQRHDGSATDISFRHSITNRTSIHKIKMACRSAIKNIIINYRENNVMYGLTKCAISGEILTKENIHVDHYDLSFNDVVMGWLKFWDMKYLESKLNDTEDNNIETYFIDKKIISDFIEYHNKNTHLRAVTQKVNLTRKWK